MKQNAMETECNIWECVLSTKDTTDRAVVVIVVIEDILQCAVQMVRLIETGVMQVVKEFSWCIVESVVCAGDRIVTFIIDKQGIIDRWLIIGII